MYELIITEKPSAAKKIAEALNSGKLVKEVIDGVTVYNVTYKNKDLYVVSAVGHLFTVAEKQKSFSYPSFDIHWAPLHEIDKKASFSKKYFNVIKKIAKKSKSFTVACDYDVEGEVIGLNVVRYICNQKDASRMKFSTLVKEDVVEAYEHKQKTLDWGQALAGETRHFLDWMYGINLSRALTLAVKKAGSFKILSSGRVQGPALKIIVDKEKEIKAFKPEPYWQITLKANKDKYVLEAIHEKDKIWVKKEAENIYNNIKDEKKVIVRSIERKKFKQAPPNPFDLGSLQAEAYRAFGMAPKKTLQIAQNLYLQGLTSYPRTSSQKLPANLGFKKILENLAKVSEYKTNANYLLSLKSLKPNEGKKTDPAHPAIYPTGLIAKIDETDEKKLYDLIVKRFMATFGEDAERETATIKLDVKKELFDAKGTITTKKGWHTLYEPYVKLSEEEVPDIKNGEELKIKQLDLLSKQTQPPKRYTPASIIAELEKRGLGTKATRADIVESLYDRGYINDKSIEATDLGIKIDNILEKHCPEITDEEFTRKIEEEMEKIRDKSIKPEEVLDHAKLNLNKILSKIKKQEKEIGQELIDANNETRDALNTLGSCPVCKDGNIMIRRGKFGAFAACNKYPECKTTFNLPKNGLVKPTTKVSPKGYPIILVIRKGKQPLELSLNAEENNSGASEDQKKQIESMKKGKLEKNCPKCGSALVVRTSIYGQFIACSNYPKCKYTESSSN